jgi:hypothetical protein
LGVLLSAAVLVVVTLLDDTIHYEEYILQNYSTPILAKIPNLVDEGGGKHYGYYYREKDKANEAEGG